MTASAQLRTLPLFASDASGARFSADRRYRYHLWRAWGDIHRRCVFVGVNPSLADEENDDLTIRKCLGFCVRWGFGALDMVNLFGWVSTVPRGLPSDLDAAVGEGNDEAMRTVFAAAARVVWAWGDPPNARIGRLMTTRAGGVRLLAKEVRPGLEHGALGYTISGRPRHPSRIAYATPFVVET